MTSTKNGRYIRICVCLPHISHVILYVVRTQGEKLLIVEYWILGATETRSNSSWQRQIERIRRRSTNHLLE